eukprot:9337611-Lingulodinium_polyedra.AAC.1
MAEATRAAEVYQRMGEAQRRILLAAGGQGTGATWTTNATKFEQYLPNAHWQMATLLRMGADPQ